MADQQEPAKRVVKRVVKKTVTRPNAPPQPPAPTMRYGRPVATAGRPRTGAPQARAASRPTGRPVAKTAPRPKVSRQRPVIKFRARTAGARDLTGRAWWAAADTATHATRATGRVLSARARTVAAWRLPHVHPVLATVITGAVVGLVAVALSAAALAIFESVRGVSSGGGLWGGLTFVAVATITLFLGESMLRGFGAHAPRLTSFLAVMLAIAAMLGLLLGVLEGALAIALVPLLSAAAYVIAHWLIEVAEHAPTVAE